MPKKVQYSKKGKKASPMKHSTIKTTTIKGTAKKTRITHTPFKNQYIENKNYYSDDQPVWAEYFYVPPNKIIGERDGKWEHTSLHTFENAEQYYQEIPPVPVEKIGVDTFKFEDGFHRVNFCIKNNLPIPCMIVHRKPKTHYHKKRYGTMTNHYVIFDKECKSDLEDSRAKCDKDNNYWNSQMPIKTPKK